MFDELLTPVTYAITFFVAIFLVVGVLTTKMDTNSQIYCDDAVHEFVDKARASGYISADSYLRMMEKINATGNLYEVEIMHQSSTSVPYVDSTGLEVKGKYVESYNAYYKDEILNVLFPENSTGYENYPLKNGDFIKVNYYLKEPTLGAKVLGMIGTRTPKTIGGTYSGYVGSTEENGMK